MLRTIGTCIFAGLLACTLLTGHSWADFEDMSAASDQASEAEVAVGYRAMSLHGTPNRAREYDKLDSGPTLDLGFKGNDGDKYFFLDAHYLNDDDFSVDTDLNLHSQLRFMVRTERMFHNLDHIPYDQSDDPEARGASFYAPQAQPNRHDYDDKDPGDDYGLRLDQTEVKMRAKLPDYPAHLNLKYWRWEKDGKQQQRYVRENCAGACHMTSQSRDVDRVTEEFSGSIDAHLGFFDLIFEQIVRTFDEKSSTPFDDFEFHALRLPGSYQHDENPDSTFTQSTLKAHTTLGGGLVANASLSIGERENDSDLYDVRPVDADMDFTKIASDVTYVPSANWTLNFRYRFLDLDYDNSSAVTADGASFTFGPVPRSFPYEVRDSMDIDRAYYFGSVAYRPTPRITLKGDYTRETIERSNTNGPEPISSLFADPVVIDPYWELPRYEVKQKFRVSLASRHLHKNALKLKAWYQYNTSDDPAYSASIEDGHSVFVSATYRPGVLWGGTASLKAQDNTNDNYAHSQFDSVTGNPVYYQQDRDQQQQNFSLGFWLNPTQTLNFDLNYGYLRNRIVQDVRFGNEPPTYAFNNDDLEFRQSVQTVNLGANWQATETVSCRIEGYHIRSKATYSPDFPTDTVLNYSSDFLRSTSKVDIRQNGLRGRLNMQIDEHWAAGFEASFDDYDDMGSDSYDGSAQIYMANVSRRW